LNVGVLQGADAGAWPSNQVVSPAPILGVWGRFGLDITTDSNAHVQASHDGIPIGPAVPLPAPLRKPTVVSLALGAVEYGSTGLVEASFDNVRLVLSP
jgi:hypothetical protein